jgi:hypothetical protein
MKHTTRFWNGKNTIFLYKTGKSQKVAVSKKIKKHRALE